MGIKRYSIESLQYMNIFKRATNISPLDYFEAGSDLVFVVDKAKVGAALGRRGANIKRLKDMLNKKIKVVGAGRDAKEIVCNFLYPIRAKSIEIESTVISLQLNSGSERRLLLNNQQSRLRLLKQIVNRYHPEISEIKVL